jgi:Spy/CpxP family protein refolding chaperone
MRTRKEVLAMFCAASVMLLLWSTGAFAQPPGSAQNEKAWELQAKTVAKDLELSDEQAGKLADAYKAARDSHSAAVASLRGQQTGGGRGDMRAFQEANQAERAKFETVLKGFLNEEQTAKALATLGTFNRRWDMMVMALDGLGLDEKAQGDAMKLVAGHVAESGKAMNAARASGNMEAARESNQKLREKLEADLGKILNAEQMAKWNEATAMRAGDRRGGAGRPGGRQTP